MCKVFSWVVTALLTFGLGVVATRMAGTVICPAGGERELLQSTAPAEKVAQPHILIRCPCGGAGTTTFSSPCGLNRPFEIEVDGVVRRHPRGHLRCRKDE